jgi:hypothetical protein
MRPIIKSALAIGELAYTLDNIANDDKKKIEEYTDSEILHEAKYVLGQFQDAIGGHWNYEDLQGKNGIEQQEEAKSQVKKLKALIKKFN